LAIATLLFILVVAVLIQTGLVPRSSVAHHKTQADVSNNQTFNHVGSGMFITLDLLPHGDVSPVLTHMTLTFRSDFFSQNIEVYRDSGNGAYDANDELIIFEESKEGHRLVLSFEDSPSDMSLGSDGDSIFFIHVPVADLLMPLPVKTSVRDAVSKKLLQVDYVTLMIDDEPQPITRLSHYDIDVHQKYLEIIEKAIPDDAKFINDSMRVQVPGVLHANDMSYDILMEIRGDQFNHWLFEKKSWRISIQDENYFNSMRVFDLIIPDDRSWFAAPLNRKHAKEMGFIQPRIEFVTVAINESEPMIYLQVEHWSKEMFERQGRSGEVQFFKNEFGGDVFQNVNNWGAYFDAENSQVGTKEAAQLLLETTQKGAHEHPGFRQKVQTIFDIRKLFAWYNLSLLAGNNHVIEDNIKMFFDTSTGRYEPIPWDIHLYAPIPLEQREGNPIWDEVFQVPEWKEAAMQMLREYVNDNAARAADRDFIERLRWNVEDALVADTHFRAIPAERNNDLEYFIQLIEDNVTFLKNILNNQEQPPGKV